MTAAFLICFQATAIAAAPGDLYQNPKVVKINGYSGDAMEPCISPNGRYLFWNNSNELKDTHIFFARRRADDDFDFAGEVPGLRGPTREMAPSLDRAGNFYFTSQRTFDRDHASIFVGQWHAESPGHEGVTNVHAVDGKISPDKPFWINMDCGIAPGGQDLYLSLARFLPAISMPVESELLLARKSGAGNFVLVEDQNILDRVNNADNGRNFLKYAPHLTDDGLELYYTRAGKPNLNPFKSRDKAGDASISPIEIVVARRFRVTEPFAAPEKIKAIEGFAEAPSLTLDKKLLYFHKKVDGRFYIYVIGRKIPKDEV